MGTTSLNQFQTLADVASEYANDQLLYIAKTLARNNDILVDAAFTQANQLFSHKGAQDGLLPTPGFRMFNSGVSVTQPKSRPIVEPMAIADDYGEVDWDMYRIQPEPEKWRQGKDAKHIEGMGQKIATTIFYGNLGTDPLAFNGYATRFNTLTYAPNGDTTWPYSVQGASGTGNDTTSVYVIEWDQEECCLIYPRGSQAGIEFEDLGRDTKVDANGKQWEILRSHFTWKCGIYVSDERRVQRVANIESAGSSNIMDPKYLVNAIMNLPSRGLNKGATFIYVNRTVAAQMWNLAISKTNAHFTAAQALDGGGMNYFFDGIPIRICDAIVNTETAIS